MGYETIMRVGICMKPDKEYKVGPVAVEDNVPYQPCLKDSKGEFIPTGRQEVVFLDYVKMDLCKIGDSEVYKVQAASVNKKKDIAYKWFVDGNILTETDAYGDRFTPVSIDKVIKALEKDVQFDPYRRFLWALDLLKSMKKTQDDKEFMVMFEGH